MKVDRLTVPDDERRDRTSEMRKSALEAPRFKAASEEDRCFVFESTINNLPDMVGESVPVWSWNDFLSSWEKTINFILTIGGNRVGFLRWERDPDALHLADLQIEPEYRRMSLATQAVAFFEDQAIAAGFSKVSLVVHHKNQSAQALYAKLGYICEQRDERRSLLIKRLALA
jgi:ribosomal protein S18 acetylase RimI-like enzyme